MKIYTECTNFDDMIEMTQCTKNHPEYIRMIQEYLLQHPDKINNLTHYGDTALTIVAKYSNLYSTEETVQMLINTKADLNKQDIYGRTALMLASLFSNITSTEKTVQILIDTGAKYKYYDYINVNRLQLKYNGLFFLDIPIDKQIKYYDISIKSYPYLLKHLYTIDVSNIIQILPFRCQFYHYFTSKKIIDTFMAIKN